MKGYLRSDGRKGIRNVIVVAYLVECAHHVAREIGCSFRDRDVHLVGFPGCFPNAYADRIMRQLTTHPNVGAALLVSLGCESFDRAGLAEAIKATGRPVHTLVIQESGGTANSVAEGTEWIRQTLETLKAAPQAEMEASDLVVATICGGSDATSGLTANPAVGRASDLLIERGATVIFEETGELIGCEHFMADRAANEDLGREIVACVEKAARYYTAFGHSSFAPGNADGGLTTIEEKSLGAYSKSGKSTIAGLIKPGDIPPRGGLYLMDVVPDGEPRFGFPNISDNAEIVEMIASGAHLTLFTTGRGSVVGSAISPVIKVCANPETFRRMGDDMDVNAGRILEENLSLDSMGQEIVGAVMRTASGTPTRSEALRHQEFILTYKTFEPIGPACLPG